jgi:hypothetical protein
LSAVLMLLLNRSRQLEPTSLAQEQLP